MVRPAQQVIETDSLWTAITSGGPRCGPLRGDIDSDVVVIGAGFTGLSTALNLRKAGVQVVVLEAAVPGWGATTARSSRRCHAPTPTTSKRATVRLASVL
jgi:NADPH-dependent 2,4-dienoyl-CoA reductase/sulfur reductase-like enzyme